MQELEEISNLIPIEQLDHKIQHEIPIRSSETKRLQTQVENKCILKLLTPTASLKNHFNFLNDPLKEGLASYYVALDASKPWILYWIFHSLSLLGYQYDSEYETKAVNTLRSCLNPDGGFGGGVGQITHLATTYAAINTIALIGTQEAYNLINKQKLLELFKSLNLDDGSFRVHDGGEVDIRATYCVFSICKLVGIDTTSLKQNCASFVGACQGWDGGIGPYPGVESHGGYTFCGLAALMLMEEINVIDIDRLCFWLVSRQQQIEGGFCGRTNKLVDGCYTFWIGASLSLVQSVMKSGNIYDVVKLQNFVLKCCQCKDGGLRDKPGK